MMLLHDSYDHTGSYLPVCNDCVLKHEQYKNSPLYVDGFHGSCTLHSGRSQIIPRGNPMCSREVISHLQQVRKAMSSWVVKGNVQLLPGEVRHLRSYLVGSGSLANFQVYVMILLGIKLFLRADELIKLKVDDFLKDFQIITDGKLIKALPLKIKGEFFYYAIQYSIIVLFFVLTLVSITYRQVQS
jgi:hypothetical protein